jgi:hypothetical protein
MITDFWANIWARNATRAFRLSLRYLQVMKLRFLQVGSPVYLTQFATLVLVYTRRKHNIIWNCSYVQSVIRSTLHHDSNPYRLTTILFKRGQEKKT